MATAQSEISKRNTALHLAILKQMITLATSGFGFVAALAWNSFIQELVNQYIKPYLPHGSSSISLFIYALVVTVIGVFVTYQLSKFVQQIERIEEELDKLRKSAGKKNVN